VLADAVDVSGLARQGRGSTRFVLAAGRMVRKKGFDLLLRAWAGVRERIAASLWMVGDGPERPRLERLAADLDVSDSVRFLGAMPHRDLLGLLEQAALCVVPSREEPYGIVVLEAQALGVPVLASAVGNIPELVKEGSTGYLTAPTVRDIADGLVRAWWDPHRSSVGAAGRRASWAKRTFDVMAQELEAWAQLANAGE